jgi:large subunit ribosomal protein L25
MSISINAVKRDVKGTGASRRARRAGSVPGVVYGGGQPLLI